MDYLVRTNADKETAKSAFRGLLLSRPTWADHFKPSRAASMRRAARWEPIKVQDADIAAELVHAGLGLQLSEGVVLAMKIDDGHGGRTLQTWFAVGLEWMGLDATKGYLKFYTKGICRDLEGSGFRAEMAPLK